MLKKISSLLLILALLLTLTSSALAEPFVTPLRHANQDFRDEMWAVIIRDVAPQVGAKLQEKWSASRCREVTDMFEAAGFVISDEVKDELYRKPREHRWYASEAWMMLLESQFGREWIWSLTDTFYMYQANSAAVLANSRYLLPDESVPSLDAMTELFLQEIALQPAMAEDSPEGYHIVARLLDWAGAVRWELCAFPSLDVQYPRYDFELSYNTETNEYELSDWRPANQLTDQHNAE